jgi:cytochrome c551/c552
VTIEKQYRAARTAVRAALLGVLSMVASLAAAADPAAIAEKAKLCSGCHGPDCNS